MLDRTPSKSQQRLIQGGISPRHARRLLREFAEHRADIVAERGNLGENLAAAQAAAAARLGSEERFVDAALARPELRSWVRRRPWAAFAVAPLLTFASAFVLFLLGLAVLFEWRKAHDYTLSAASPTIHWLTECANIFLLWALPIAIAVSFALLAARRREVSGWPLVGILVTSILGALTNLNFDLPPAAADPGMGAGIGLNTDHLGPALVRAGSTAALAVLPLLWIRHLHRRDPNV